MSVLLTEAVIIGDGSSQCALTAPLELTLQYSVRSALVRPVWTLTYVADVASEKVESVLASSVTRDGRLTPIPTPDDADTTATLLPGHTYALKASIPASVMQRELADKIALKYLLQIGTLTFTVRGEKPDSAAEGSPAEQLTGTRHVVCQVRQAAGDAALVRTLLQ